MGDIGSQTVRGGVSAAPLFLYGLDLLAFDVLVGLYLMLILGVTLGTASRIEGLDGDSE